MEFNQQMIKRLQAGWGFALGAACEGRDVQDEATKCMRRALAPFMESESSQQGI